MVKNFSMDMERNLPLSSGGVSTNFFPTCSKSFMPNSLSSILICSETADEVKKIACRLLSRSVFGDQAKDFELPKFHKKNLTKS